MEVESVNELSPKAARAQLLGLAVSHLPGLDPEALKLLNTSASDILDQLVLQHSDQFLLENIDDLLQLLLEVLLLCHFSAKCHRLQCLYFLIVHISKVPMIYIICIEFATVEGLARLAYEFSDLVSSACIAQKSNANCVMTQLSLALGGFS
ncbi:hypothetical protein MKW92_001592 [Papaver armeniacum]|nr:hypothetical protein MKW92_001592 [Papaver armeniacum]